MTRREQIHAAIYNAAVDAGFMLYAGHNGVQDKVMVKDLLEDTPHFELTFIGKDISDMDVHVEGVDIPLSIITGIQTSNSLI
jgi:hypothetical protein